MNYHIKTDDLIATCSHAAISGIMALDDAVERYIHRYMILASSFVVILEDLHWVGAYHSEL